MITTLKVRLEPNNKQNTKLFQSAGTARFAYNWAVARQQENYKSGGKFLTDCDLRKELTQLKKTEELGWLNNYSNNITKQAVKDSCIAYKKYFQGLSEKPKFKSKKKSKPSFYQDTGKIKFTETHAKFEKIGWIKLSEHNRIPSSGKYSDPRVTYDGVNWYISVGVEAQKDLVVLTGESVGIDLGIKDLAICSNFEKPYKNINKTIRVKRIEKKLRRLQHKASKKYLINKKEKCYCKTNNIIKLEKSIRKLYKKLDNVKTDYIQKVTTEIVKAKPSRIVMESLNVSGMLKNRRLSRAISQQNFCKFKDIVKYKAEKSGIEFVEADKWYPSSKTCSICGHVKEKLSLSERTFVCECCGSTIDRDKNASINLSRYKIS